MKPIRFSQHARRQMLLRGATETDVTETIQIANWKPAQRGRFEARKSFAFGQPSPINQQVYAFKIVRAIFADEPNEITVVTVLVYYGDKEETQ